MKNSIVGLLHLQPSPMVPNNTRATGRTLPFGAPMPSFSVLDLLRSLSSASFASPTITGGSSFSRPSPSTATASATASASSPSTAFSSPVMRTSPPTASASSASVPVLCLFASQSSPAEATTPLLRFSPLPPFVSFCPSRS